MIQMEELDPISAPLTYPGRAPDRAAVLVIGADILDVRPFRAAPLGEWRVSHKGEDKPLDQMLLDEAVPATAQRIPVLAVGSNASPAQVRRKLSAAGLWPVVPITAVEARGLSVGVSAHVSKAGYVPATPVHDPAAVSIMWVTWLDVDELAAMDVTEPNYQRVRLHSQYSVELVSGQAVNGCWVYVSRHGYLTGRSGKPLRLTDQATLISGLLADVPALADLAGSSPKEWVRRARDESVRDDIRNVFRSAGLVRPQTDLGLQ